jgi:hypothetical protein
MSARDLFFPEHAVARHGDPETSHEAAETVNVTNGQRIVLDMFRCGPMTDHGAWTMLTRLGHRLGALSPSGFRTRRSELVAKGQLEFSGTFDTMPSGRRTRIWRVKP